MDDLTKEDRLLLMDVLLAEIRRDAIEPTDDEYTEMLVSVYRKIEVPEADR